MAFHLQYIVEKTNKVNNPINSKYFQKYSYSKFTNILNT